MEEIKKSFTERKREREREREREKEIQIEWYRHSYEMRSSEKGVELERKSATETDKATERGETKRGMVGQGWERYIDIERGEIEGKWER